MIIAITICIGYVFLYDSVYVSKFVDFLAFILMIFLFPLLILFIRILKVFSCVPS